MFFQVSVKLKKEWYDLVPGLVEQVRTALGIPGLSTSDAFVMGLQLLAEWAEKVKEKRPEIIEELSPPVVPEEAHTRTPGRGRRRSKENEGGQ